MGQLITLPFQMAIYLINTLLGTIHYIFTFTLNMVFSLISVLAPYAGTALFFASNEHETKATILVDNKEVACQNRISTPEDGEWFTQFFEDNPEIKKIEMKNGKLVMQLPPSEKKESRIVYLNWYSLKQN